MSRRLSAALNYWLHFRVNRHDDWFEVSCLKGLRGPQFRETLFGKRMITGITSERKFFCVSAEPLQNFFFARFALAADDMNEVFLQRDRGRLQAFTHCDSLP